MSDETGKDVFWAEAGRGVGFVLFAAGCLLILWGCSNFPGVPR